MENKKNKVLIVGNNAAAFATVKKFATYENMEVFTTNLNVALNDCSTQLDIREDNIRELLDFVLENEIDLTVATSATAIKADIAKTFQDNSQAIFAPTATSANFAISRAYAKKFLYKMHIPTPKFGIFEKPSIAMDYLKKSPMPLIISSDEVNDTSVYTACKTVNEARNCVDYMTLQGEDKIIVEEYPYGHNFTVYVITDGYQALPITICGDYKFLENGDGGLLTCGIGTFAPDYKVTFDVLSKVMNNVNNILSNLERRETPYLGILGIECVLTDIDRFVTTGFTPYLKDHDAQAVLNSIDENLYTLMEACTNGSFADDYEGIRTNEKASVGAVLYSRHDGSQISGLNELDDDCKVTHFKTSRNEYLEYLTNKGRTLVLTQEALTISSAKKRLYENLELVDFTGKKFRFDICKE